jgi:hypothetical protein
MIIKVGLIPNLDHETRKTITRPRHVQNKNPTRFNCKKDTKQGYDKKTYPKLMLNKLKVMGNYTFICTLWAFNSRKFLKKLSIYMWPMCINVHPCVNYE